MVKCIMEIEFSNGKKRLMQNDIQFIEEWCAENNIKINRLLFLENKYAKTRSFSSSKKR